MLGLAERADGRPTLTTERIIVVTGFEPFGIHTANPSEDLAKAVSGRRFGQAVVQSAILPVHHTDAGAMVASLLAETDPVAVLHLGLAEGRARIALERVAVNVMDFEIADNAGYRATGEPCVPDGPAAYFSTLPLRAVQVALQGAGVPAYLSATAGTYLCNFVMYTTLHGLSARRPAPAAGFMHLPLLPSMVLAGAPQQPSMDLALMLRGVEVALEVITGRK